MGMSIVTVWTWLNIFGYGGFFVFMNHIKTHLHFLISDLNFWSPGRSFVKGRGEGVILEGEGEGVVLIWGGGGDILEEGGEGVVLICGEEGVNLKKK